MVGRGSASYPLSHPRPGAAEQDPETWLVGLEAAIAAALAGLDVARVAAVAVSGQQHGLVVVDAAGKARTLSVAPRCDWPLSRADVYRRAGAAPR